MREGAVVAMMLAISAGIIMLVIWLVPLATIDPAPNPCEYRDWVLEELKHGRAQDEPVQRLVMALRECKE